MSARRRRQPPRQTPGTKPQGKQVRREPVTGRRLWLFRLIAVVGVPLVLLCLLETGLRVVGYGYQPGVTVACKVNGVPHRGDNLTFSRRFFPAMLAREFEPFVFPTRKPAGTYRVFVLGSSAAQGVPNHAFRFGRILEAMLQERFPDTRFEVITAAMAAINSHVVVEVAKDCARYEPDLFVIYMGNNEVVGPYGPGTVLTPALSNLHLIRLGIAARKTRIGQLLSGLTRGAAGRGAHALAGHGDVRRAAGAGGRSPAKRGLQAFPPEPGRYLPCRRRCRGEDHPLHAGDESAGLSPIRIVAQAGSDGRATGPLGAVLSAGGAARDTGGVMPRRSSPTSKRLRSTTRTPSCNSGLDNATGSLANTRRPPGTLRGRGTWMCSASARIRESMRSSKPWRISGAGRAFTLPTSPSHSPTTARTAARRGILLRARAPDVRGQLPCGQDGP